MHPQIILTNTTYSSKLLPNKILLSYTKLYWPQCTTVAVHAHDTAGQVLLFINTTAHPN